MTPIRRDLQTKAWTSPRVPGIMCATGTAIRKLHLQACYAPLAQLDRALPSGGRGQRFESSRVRHRVCCCRTESMAHFSPSHCIQDFENERSGNLWSDLTQADCGKKSSGSRRESHVTAGYCGDSQHRTGQFFTTTCSCRVQSEVPWMKWRTVLRRPSTI